MNFTKRQKATLILAGLVTAFLAGMAVGELVLWQSIVSKGYFGP